MNFKDNLRKCRTKTNLSQERLAEKMSVSRQTISKWENGDIYPSTKHIFMLTKIFSCSFGELIDGEPDTDKQLVTNPSHKNTILCTIGAVAILFVVIFGFLITNLPNKTIDNQKIAVFDKIIDGSLDETLLDDGYTKKEIVGYGVTKEEGLFYIKCNLYNNVDSPCSAIIYFCKNDNGYSYKCQYLDDPEYIPQGEYYKVS